jgi:hypothetical protein
MPEAPMDVADARTLKKLLQRSGCAGQTDVPAFEQFLERQQWIPQDHAGLAALRALLRRG